MNRIFIILCVFFAFLTSANAGEMYSCTDRDGNAIVTSTPQDGMENCVLKDSYSDPSPQERVQQQRQAEVRIQQQDKTGKTGCEIISFSQYEIISGVSGGGGYVVPGSGGFVTGGGVSAHKATCVDLTILNNDSAERTITNSNIQAVTQKGNKRNPKGFMAKITPGGTYQGKVCFADLLSTITEMKCNF